MFPLLATHDSRPALWALWALPISLLAATLAWSANPHVVDAPPRTPEEERRGFQLPPGFEIELVAAEPTIAKPMNLNFDAAGRLYVTQSLEYPFPAKEAPRDEVRVLTDADRDGKFESAKTLLDGLNIPIGVTPAPRGAIYWTIPEVQRGFDTDDDGLVDERKTLLSGFGVVDTHGMNNSFTRGLDGWIYACHGFRNDSHITGADGRKLHLNSGNTYRFRPDGSGLTQWTHGQVNPFGLAFDPYGDLYSADCHSKPAYLLLRGAYYPSFGKPHDGLGFGPTLIEHSHGSTAIAGIAYYDGVQFPEEYRGRIFLGNVVTNRINQDRLVQQGSTRRGEEMPDFLRSDDPWFRPVEVQLGPDGALYVADFYNRIIGHYEVPLDHPGRDRERGRIWRIWHRGEGKARPELPNLTRLDLPQLIERLGSPNITERTLATHEVVDRFGEQARDALTALLSSAAAEGNPNARVHALWALERIGSLSDELFRQQLEDPAPRVRVHALRAAAERDWSGAPSWLADAVRKKLADESPLVRRAAADALARHPAPEHLAPLLQAWQNADAADAALIHVARMAVRDQLVAGGFTEAAQLAAKEEDARGRLVESTLGAKTPAAAEFLFGLATAGQLPPSRRDDALYHIARQITPPRLPAAARLALDSADPSSGLRRVQQAFSERGLPLPMELRKAAVAAVGKLLQENDEAAVLRGLALARELRLVDAAQPILGVAASRDRDEAVRTAAIETLAAIRPPTVETTLAELLAGADQPPAVRQKAAEGLAAVNTPAARERLVQTLQTKVHAALAEQIALSLTRSRPGAETIVVACEQGQVSPRLLLHPTIRRQVEASGLPEAAARVAKLTSKLPAPDEALTQLIAARKTKIVGGAFRSEDGATLFRQHCAACHKFGALGAKVGPELDGIGRRGLDRLLEDVLDPSQNVDPAFRSTTIVTTDGRVLSGLLLRREGETLILADPQGKEVAVPANEVDEQQTLPVSAMPANVARDLKPEELGRLLRFLMSDVPRK